MNSTNSEVAGLISEINSRGQNALAEWLEDCPLNLVSHLIVSAIKRLGPNEFSEWMANGPLFKLTRDEGLTRGEQVSIEFLAETIVSNDYEFGIE